MTDEDCENCRFYMAIDDRIGGCNRYPPVYKPENTAKILIQDGKPLEAFDPREWSFPIVERWDWCGEYREFKRTTND